MQIQLNTIRFRFVLMLLVSLVVADGLITKHLIDSGVASESNPFLKDLFANGSALPFKIAGAVLSALLLAFMSRHHPKLASLTSWCFIAVYTGIVWWNLGLVWLR